MTAVGSDTHMTHIQESGPVASRVKQLSELVHAPEIRRNSPVRISKGVKRTVTFLEKLAPRTVARTAARLWWTPPSPKTFTEIPGGEVVQLGPVQAQIFGSGPLVYLVHGWGGHRGQLGSLVQPLVDAGFGVLAYDAPSHGGSQAGVFGKGKTTIYEMMDTLSDMVAVFGPAHAVIAHSLGGAATSVQVAQGLPVEKVVLICPPTDPIQFAAPFGKAFGLSDNGVQRMIHRIAKLSGHRNSHADVIAHLGKTAAPLPPALIISDSTDKEVDYRDGVEISKAWPGSLLKVSHGLGHRRILKDDGIIAQMVEFVAGAAN